MKTGMRSAAAVMLAAVVLAGGCSSEVAPEPWQVESSVTSPVPYSSDPPDSIGSTVEGFVGVEDFPIEFVVPPSMVDTSGGGGTRTYAIDGTSAKAGILLITSVAGTRAAELPADLAAFIGKARNDTGVSDVRATEVAGVAAQEFTLAQKPGNASSDVLCVTADTCIRVVDYPPLHVTAVRTERGLVVFTLEYLRQHRAQAQEAMEKLLASVRWR